ncbi:TetR/AcrR family transcriptional regulator [Salinibacterium sp. UTAS2018]|uniref:TetR/AcrR family transcriptional regulator n=1 Tax=Salinibacterium sp. UTAS2018 TaxID=2508880 RepID=UPI0010095E5D|nr:TetR/AcrR family transcriptional regulator [Salinibacterium sp. UTAS2018]QAV69834.1 TetR/AcrR family transcriptional regulator [Salinibacterium sp. UTAS2018]
MPNPANVRTEPVQQRSAERISVLLDAAAVLLDEVGIDALTTSDVSKRAQSSVGVIYRYFPNIQSLLRGLAERNFDKYRAGLSATLNKRATSALDALNIAIDVYIELCRTEPGFRVLSFGNIIDRRFNVDRKSNNTALAEILTDLLVTTYEVPATDALAFDIEVTVEIADSLLERAFLYDPRGEEPFIIKLREFIAQLLAPHTKEAVTP